MSSADSEQPSSNLATSSTDEPRGVESGAVNGTENTHDPDNLISKGAIILRHEATTAAALPVRDAPGSSFPVLDVSLPRRLRVLPYHCRRCPSIEKMHSYRWSQRRPPTGALHEAVGDCLPREGVEFGPAHHLQLVSGVRSW